MAEPTPAQSKELWLGFLKEWKDEAQEKGSKSANAYNTAYKALKSNPKQFRTPKELIEIKGIGATIVDKVFKALEKWCIENGQEMPTGGGSALISPPKPARGRKKASESNSNRGRPTAGPSKRKGRTRSDSLESASDQEPRDDGEDRPPKKSRASKSTTNKSPPKGKGKEPASKRAPSSKRYVPKPRSGGHGILIALYLHTSGDSLDDGEDLYLTKSEIISDAQPFCDSDYTSGSLGSSSGAGPSSLTTSRGGSSGGNFSAPNPKTIFTAWNNMKTLIEKGYVYQTGNPPKFCLTQDGFEMARQLANAEGARRQSDFQDEEGEGINFSSGNPSQSRPEFFENAFAERRIGMEGRSASTSSVLGGTNKGVSRLVLPEKPPARKLDSVKTIVGGLSAGPFHFVYIDDASRPTRSQERNKAAVRLSDDDYVPLYRVEFPASLSDHPFAKANIQKVEDVASGQESLGGSDGKKIWDEVLKRGYLKETCAMEQAPGLGITRTNSSIRTESQQESSRSRPSSTSQQRESLVIDTDSDDDIIEVDPSQVQTKPSKSISPVHKKPPPITSSALTGLSRTQSDSVAASSSKSTGVGLGNRTQSTSSGLPSRSRRNPRLSDYVPPPGVFHKSHAPTTEAEENSTSDMAGEASLGSHGGTNLTAASDPGSLRNWTPPTFEPEIIPAGSYTIQLILDNREVETLRNAGASAAEKAAGTDKVRRSLADNLRAKGVDCIVKPLAVGDALWVAKRNHGGGTSKDEAVLDFIVERKRLDDLVSSIMGTRWTEQKFRLASSGLSQVTYLIEDFDVARLMGQWNKQIRTALSSVQVIDGFFLEHTANTDASVECLARMHKVIVEAHANLDLYVIPDKYISRPSYLRLQAYLRRRHPSRPYLTSFTTFSSLNSKSSSTILRDVFAKMLLSLRGMSPEKVGELLRTWATPQELWKAYLEAEALQEERDEEEKRGGGNLTNGSGKGKGKRKDEVKTLLCETINPREDRRKIGPKLSEMVSDVFCSTRY